MDLLKSICSSNRQNLGPYSPTSVKNILYLVLQIFLYLEAFECNTTSDWLRTYVTFKVTKSWRIRQRMFFRMVGEYKWNKERSLTLRKLTNWEKKIHAFHPSWAVQVDMVNTFCRYNQRSRKREKMHTRHNLTSIGREKITVTQDANHLFKLHRRSCSL